MKQRPGDLPAAVRLLVQLAIRDGERADGILGDLHEEYLEDATRYGALRAGVACLKSGLGIAARYRGRRILPEDRSAGMATFAFDIWYAARQFRRSAGFSVLVALMLGFGMGSAIVIYSIAQTVVLRPLPFPDPDRLVRIRELNPAGDPYSLSAANYLDYRERSRSFGTMAAFAARRVPLLGVGEPLQLQGMSVSHGFFETLGVSPALGRIFAGDEYPVAREGDVAIISDDLWQRVFGADPGVIGRQVNIDGLPRVLVGVTPASLGRPFAADVFLPFGPDPEFPRGDHRLEAIARLRDDVTLERARSELADIASRLSEEYPSSNGGWSVRARTFNEWLIGPQSARAVVMLFGAAALLLLLTCASVSNVLVARTTARQRETAVRAALGAGRARVLRQFLVESLLLSGTGAGIGLAIAYASIPVIRSLNSEALPRLYDLGLQPVAAVFAVLLAVVTAAVFGGGPAWLAARQDPGKTLQSGARAVPRGSRRLRDALVTVQLALALVLLVGAGLLGGSFLRLTRVDPGFDAEQVLAASISPRGDRFPPYSVLTSRFYRDLEERVEALPGVRAVGSSMVDPFRGLRPANQVGTEAATEISELVEIQWRAVTPGYFRTMAIPLLRGRYLDEADNDLARFARGREAGLSADISVLISAALAERLWPGAEPIGQRMVWNQPGGMGLNVVGVVGEVRDIALTAAPEPTAYLPNGIIAWPEMTLFIRTAGDPAALAGPLREAIRSVDPDTPVPEVRRLEQSVADELAGSRLNLELVGFFAFAALLLAALGLYGVVSYSVARRTKEMGIRIALGARPRTVLGLVMRDGGLLTAIGIVLGTLAALALSRFLAGVLFEIRPTHPATYAGVAAFLACIALLASWIPARRATRVDPRTALATE